MNPTIKRLLILFVYVSFLALSVWATMSVGYFGIFAAAISGPGEMQLFADLCVACSLGSAYVYRDARKRGHNPWPWLLMVLPLGSIPLITYVVVRDWLPAHAPSPVGA